MYSSDTTKYMIHIHLEAEGVVEKPDVVGAVFGQTEGLLGEDLDLRDLQRTGRLGRIDVQVTSKKGETKGEIYIASSLDRAETAILAASFETIDRVGPCVARVRVESIEDIRVTKRRQVISRARELLMDAFEEGTIDSNILIDEVRESMRMDKIGTIGDDKVPAGPNVADSDAIIVVEGRADVLNLLRFGIKNAVAVEGTRISRTIVDLCEKKTATAFFDGDRGGDLILRELLQVAEIDYVAYSPRGKSVEDLSRKEIVKALRNKIPVEYVREELAGEEEGDAASVTAPASDQEVVSRKTRESVPSHKKRGGERPAGAPASTAPRTLTEHLAAMRGSRSARFLSRDFTVIRDVDAQDIERALEEMNGDAVGLLLDGEVNQKLLDTLAGKGLEYVAAIEYKGIIKRPLSIKLLKMA
ncbi:MAG TPA: DNA primase DnaG [Methanolinea sp.]|nr:DNA primase DnaG [Methanolinea sp.]HQK55671.1 DNA primase DnaG [Methanolinea sp.]